MSKQSAARLAIRDALIQLVDDNSRFNECVKNDHNLPLWLMEENGEINRDQAADICTRLTYDAGQNQRTTERLTGIIGISEPTLHAGRALNVSRMQFKVTVGEFRQLFGDDVKAIEHASEDLREGLLGGLKVANLHFLQCYRQLKLFETRPERIGFSWAATHSGTVKLTAAQAIDHFRTKYMSSVAIDQDIVTLEQLPAERIVVIKRELAPHLRANIRWPKPIELTRLEDDAVKQQHPKQVNSPLPIFILLKPGQLLPLFNPIKPLDWATKPPRARRSDSTLVKLNDDPFSRIFVHEA